jgi:hypothetical protein
VPQLARRAAAARVAVDPVLGVGADGGVGEPGALGHVLAANSLHHRRADELFLGFPLSSLSFGSDTDFLSDTYVIVDPEVERNGTVVLGSLLHPAAIMNIMAILDEEPAQQTVFFPAFSRYFVAKGKWYENMIADLIWHL